MARLSFLTLLLCFAAFLLASDPSLIKVPQRTAGVFMLIEGGRYTFNFSAARAACLFLNVTIATRAQMERALQHGLETCKYGWIAEQIGVIPRLKSDKNCGQGKTGVVTWAAQAHKQFGVFCFDAAELEDTVNTSTASPRGSTIPTALTAWSRASAAATAPALTAALNATQSTGAPSTSATLQSLSTHIPTTPVSPLITSRPTLTSFVFSTSAHPSSLSVSSESATQTPASPAKPSLRDVHTALIVLGILLLLLTAAGAAWYYKLNISTFLSPRDTKRLKDDIETEMWKHTDSEMDLHSQHEGEEEEESDRKYSSDITLCVNPNITIISAE